MTEDERLTPEFPKGVPQGTPVELAKEGLRREGRPAVPGVCGKER